MGNHGRVACTSDLTHGHLSGCDDCGDAVGGFGFATVEVVGHPTRSLRSRVPSLRERDVYWARSIRTVTPRSMYLLRRSGSPER